MRTPNVICERPKFWPLNQDFFLKNKQTKQTNKKQQENKQSPCFLMHLDLTFSRSETLLSFSLSILQIFYLKSKMCSKRRKILSLGKQQIPGLEGETQC